MVFSKHKTKYFSVVLVPNLLLHQIAQHNRLEDYNFSTYCHENFISRDIALLFSYSSGVNTEVEIRSSKLTQRLWFAGTW
jgi:hypothetical protein